ncbi:MAG: serine/threonine transporter SstT [Coriobacteriia bacterium]|nr:serine/threonine transporter SstT [Coriobacteriia bacterium]
MSVLKDLGTKWNDLSLIIRILIGLVAGVVLALVMPGNDIIPLFGDIFVAALKAVAPVLVLFIVMSALANAKTAGSMKSVVLMYVVGTLIAGIVGVMASFAFPCDLVLVSAEDVTQSSPSGIGEVLTTLVMKIFTNPVDALMNANYLGVLAWAILLGVAFRKAPDNFKNALSNIADAINQVVRWVIALAPFGIWGLVYTSVSENGVEIFINYGQIIVVLVACMLFIALVTNPIIAFIGFRKNPYPLVLRTLKDSGLMAFFTRSSAANIPVNMELCRKLGLNEDTYGVSIPLGATINMGGAAVTISVMSMAAAHTLGMSIDPVTAIILCVLAAVSACGASGVAGGSLLLIPLACSLFGISNDIAMQVVAIGFIIGVIQDSCETALNSSSDVLFTATAEYAQMRKEGKEFHPGKDAVAEG